MPGWQSRRLNGYHFVFATRKHKMSLNGNWRAQMSNENKIAPIWQAAHPSDKGAPNWPKRHHMADGVGVDPKWQATRPHGKQRA